MKLLVDAGNSCLKWAWLDDELKTGGRVLRGKKTAKAVLAEAWDECETEPDEVLVANVAGESFRRSLTAYIKKRWSIKAEYLTTATQQCGVKNSYEKPETLGVDRWLAMLGARAIKNTPFCVIDCGTALTIDVVDKSGQHMGGLIMPGMHLMRQSLVDSASGIKEQPHLSEARPASFLASDTDNAIIVGTLYTAIAAIDRIVNDVRAELGNALQCYITGGEATLFLPLIDQLFRHEPDLVFKGMQALQSASSPAKKDQSHEAITDEARPDKTTADETASSEDSKPRKKSRPRRKSRARKENKPVEQEQNSEASQPVAETQPDDTGKANAVETQSEVSKPESDSQDQESDASSVEDEKTREQAL